MRPKKISFMRRLALLATAALLIHPLLGQQTNQSVKESDVVELSPFVIDTTSDVGYAAQNTLAGSRLNTALKDVASPLEIFTKEFLDDIAATSLGDAMLYHSNAQEDLGDENPSMQQDYKAQAQVPNRFRVRGQLQTRARNYFSFNLPQDLFSIERVDASRGPNSILFGIGNAGGVTNTQSKQAHFRKNVTNLGMQFGNNGHRRFTIDHNQVLNNNLAFRINLLDQSYDGWQVYGRDEREGAQISGAWHINAKTRLRADAEWGTKGDYASRTYPVLNRASHWDEAGRPVFDPSVVRTTANLNAQSSAFLTVTNPNTNADVRLRLLNGVSNNNADRFYWVDNGDGLFFSSANRYNFINRGDQMLDEDEIYGTMINGPSALRDLDYKTFSVFLEHQFTRDFQIELAVNRWDHDWQSLGFGNEARLVGEASSNFYRDAPSSAIVSGASTVTSIDHGFGGSLYYEDTARPDIRTSDNTEFRITSSYELNTEKFGSHRFAAMLSTSDLDRTVTIKEARVLTDGFGNLIQNPESGAYRLYSRHYLTDENDPREFRNADLRLLPSTVSDPFTGRTFETGYSNLSGNTTAADSSIDSALISMQNYWLNDRLVTTLGYRYDDSNTVSFGTDEIGTDGRPTGNLFRDATTFQPMVNRADINRDVSSVSRTSTLGAVFHLNDQISLTYNRSSNAGPPFGGWAAPNVVEAIDTATLAGTGDNEPLAPTGEGEDYGLNFSLLDNRVYVRANYFKTTGTGSLTWTNSGFDNRFADIISALAGRQVFRNTVERAAIPDGSIGLLQLDNQGQIIENSGTPEYEVISNLIPTAMPRPNFRARDNDFESTGYEINMTANLSRNISVRAGYSYTERETFDTWRMAQLFSTKVREWALSGDDFDPAILNRIPVRRISGLSEAQAAGSFIQDSSERYYLTALDVLDYDIDEGLAIALDNAQQGFGQRNHKANIWTSYKFTEGFFSGLSVFGGIRYQSGAEVGYRLFFDENGAQRRDESKVETNDSQFFNDAGVSYVTNADWVKEGAKLRLQLNVRNVFDDTDYDVARDATDSFGRVIVTRYYVPTPRRITFSANLTF